MTTLLSFTHWCCLYLELALPALQAGQSLGHDHPLQPAGIMLFPALSVCQCRTAASRLPWWRTTLVITPGVSIAFCRAQKLFSVKWRHEIDRTAAEVASSLAADDRIRWGNKYIDKVLRNMPAGADSWSFSRCRISCTAESSCSTACSCCRASAAW